MVARESGIADSNLVRGLTPKVLELVRVLAAHGHASVDEILTAVGLDEASGTGLKATPERERFEAVESDLAAERSNRSSLERENARVRADFERAVGHWREAERRAAVAEQRLIEIQDGLRELVTATRDSVTSLQRLRGDLGTAAHSNAALAAHVRDVRAIIEIVQSLRVPKRTTSQAPSIVHRAR